MTESDGRRTKQRLRNIRGWRDRFGQIRTSSELAADCYFLPPVFLKLLQKFADSENLGFVSLREQ